MKQIFEGKKIFVFERDGWEFVERKSAKEAVAVIAVAEDNEAILTEQFRRPLNARVIDWPAGLIEKDDAATTAIKELREETGFDCDRVELLAKGPTSPGITSEQVTFYRAYGVRRVDAGGGVEGEDITVHTIALEKLGEWLRHREGEGILIDLKIWAGLYFLS